MAAKLAAITNGSRGKALKGRVDFSAFNAELLLGVVGLLAATLAACIAGDLLRPS